MKAIMIASAMIVVGGGGIATAADVISLKPDDVIAARQSAYALQGGLVEAMKAGVASGSSVKPYAEGLKAIVMWSQVLPAMFPVGTESGHDTKAKPDVWSDNATFLKDAANLTEQAKKLVVLADADDKAGFATQFAAMGQACGACHRQFRAR